MFSMPIFSTQFFPICSEEIFQSTLIAFELVTSITLGADFKLGNKIFSYRKYLNVKYLVPSLFQFVLKKKLKNIFSLIHTEQIDY